VGIERNLPVVANKTVEQAERELIYRALVDLKSNIIEMKELLTGRVSGAYELQGNPAEPHNGNGVLTMDEMERRMISGSLDRNNGNRRLAAKELNISERTLYRKIKDFGLQ
jgi:transcriptional regulator with PAS, ATPase and Fis domain